MPHSADSQHHKHRNPRHPTRASSLFGSPAPAGPRTSHFTEALSHPTDEPLAASATRITASGDLNCKPTHTGKWPQACPVVHTGHARRPPSPGTCHSVFSPALRASSIFPINSDKPGPRNAAASARISPVSPSTSNTKGIALTSCMPPRVVSQPLPS